MERAALRAGRTARERCCVARDRDGNVSPHVDRVPIDRVGFLPSDVEPAGGGLLISQTEPIPVGQQTLATLIR